MSLVSTTRKEKFIDQRKKI